MSVPEKAGARIYRYGVALEKGSLGRLLDKFGADVIIGHPTYFNDSTIGPELEKGILGAPSSFPGQKIAFIVSDGTLTRDRNDPRTLDAAIAAAAGALSELGPEQRERILVVAGSYDGYDGNTTAGKGSALRVIYEEMAFVSAQTLILLDGDLRNDVAHWQAVYKKVIDAHRIEFPDRNYFITARYARHFVDASITRQVVGPLTTLFGTFVPGGISGDIVLSADAVALERKSEWTDERRRYGTDIATTFDNIARGTVIYEAYLGAKLHDITDDAKLSVMPGEVIGSALERLLHYERLDRRVSRVLEGDAPLKHAIAWGPEKPVSASSTRASPTPSTCQKNAPPCSSASLLFRPRLKGR
ncbi:MAG: hypothetical protein V1913_01735 [Fibrobacterota bacterium]